MKPVLVDSNILIDIFNKDDVWGIWSKEKLIELSQFVRLFINPIIYSEISISYKRIEQFENILRKLPLVMDEIPRAALFLAGKAFVNYRRKGGSRITPLPDFFIGAHAAVRNFRCITRDPARIAYYFPNVEIISPHQH